MVTLKQSSFLPPQEIAHQEKWLERLHASFPLHYVKAIEPALLYVKQLHHTVANEKVLNQSLGMADILLELQTDPETIIAALLCTYVQQQHITLESVSQHFGIVIIKLITGMLRMEAIHTTATNSDTQHPNIDNLRKMMLAMIDDIRVVLIKLAEQTWLIRQTQNLPVDGCPHLAHDVMNIYAPLANRLGIGQLKWELEDLAFRLLQPQDYKEIAKSLDTRRIDREIYVQNVMDELYKVLKKAGLKYVDIMGRAKHIFSIYNKMKRKDVDFAHVYDVIAVRVLTRNVEECYTALSCVHNMWQQIPAEFDDYISKPKSNGYRSIHTAVCGPENKNIEIQIRTFQMHEESELGIAAHWKYKENAETEMSFERKIAWLRQVIEWQRDLVNHESGITHADIHSLFDDRVYVFTPAGEIIDLPSGSTPLDFAYSIHSQIGHRCRGAKINNNIVPLSYTLNTGECVEILTAKHPNPSRDWLNPSAGYIHTDKARTRINHWFKQQDAELHMQDGRHALERELKQHHFGQIDLAKLARVLHCKTVDNLCLSIGRNELRMAQVLQAAQTLSQPLESHPTEIKSPVTKPFSTFKPSTQAVSPVAVSGISNVLTSTARCCKPVPGDKVIGYITRGRGISIHRQDCSNITRLDNEARIIDVEWNHIAEEKYPVDIMLKAKEHSELLKDISALLSTEKVRLLRLNTVVSHQHLLIYLSIEIKNSDLLKRLLEKLQHIEGVSVVERLNI